MGWKFFVAFSKSNIKAIILMQGILCILPLCHWGSGLRLFVVSNNKNSISARHGRAIQQILLWYEVHRQMRKCSRTGHNMETILLIAMICIPRAGKEIIFYYEYRNFVTNRYEQFLLHRQLAVYCSFFYCLIDSLT